VTHARTVCACMDAHTHHVPATQPCCSAGNPKGAVCDVIAQLGSQAPMQHQAGLVVLAGSKVLQRPKSCKLALALTSALHTPACTRPLMITPLILECNPDARNGPRNVQAPCFFIRLHLDSDLRTGHPWLARTTAGLALPHKRSYYATYLLLPSRCTVGW